MLRRKLVNFQVKSKIPAVGAAVAAPGQPTQSEVAGSRSRASFDPVEIDDCWHIGSCAKAMTATLFAVHVEQGAIEWDTPVASGLADLSPDINPLWGEIPVEDILLGRSGLPSNLALAATARAFEDRRDLTEQRTQVALDVLRSTPDSPGRFRYSNLGYVIAGAIIDRLAKNDFESDLYERVFQPLSVETAGFGPPAKLMGHGSRVRLGPLSIGKGRPVTLSTPKNDNPPVLNSAGRVHLKLDDWAEFIKVFVSGGAGIIKPDSVARLLSVPEGRGASMAMGWAPAPQFDDAAYAMQGSNTMWAATAMIGVNLDRAVMVVANDGRSRALSGTAMLAAEILSDVGIS